MIRCALDCCFRMFESPNGSNTLTDVFLGDDEFDDYADYAVCTATKDEWEAEVYGDPDYDDAQICFEDGINGGAVPHDCPIWQGEETPPWKVD